MLAGGMNAILFNPLQAIRYQCWGSGKHFKEELLHMYKSRGILNFAKGLAPTLGRDVIFGGVFSFARHYFVDENNDQRQRRSKFGFMSDVLSAFLATAVASPFNYVRNMQYATSPQHKPHSTIVILKKLFLGYKKQKTVFKKYDYLQLRLRIGWGTARVAAGMGIASQLYETILCKIFKQNSN